LSDLPIVGLPLPRIRFEWLCGTAYLADQIDGPPCGCPIRLIGGQPKEAGGPDRWLLAECFFGAPKRLRSEPVTEIRPSKSVVRPSSGIQQIPDGARRDQLTVAFADTTSADVPWRSIHLT